MISSLIDELRKSADEWNGSNMFELARMCSDAADTIWQLRDDLQRANADNAKLRQLVRGLHMAYVGALNECEGMDSGLIWDHCEMVDAELAKSHARFEADRHRFDAAMSELGIEVDE